MISGEQFSDREMFARNWRERERQQGIPGTDEEPEERPAGLGVGRVRDFEEPQAQSWRSVAGMLRRLDSQGALADEHRWKLTDAEHRAGLTISYPDVKPPAEQEQEQGQLGLFPESDTEIDHWARRQTPAGYPPSRYYEQHTHEEPALPGMELSPHEHARAAGMEYTFHPGGQWAEPHHRLDYNESYLKWAHHTSSHPGEIMFVRSESSGDAAAMHAVARKIAMEHPDVPLPRHSGIRTSEGVPWSQKEMRKYNEEEW